MLFHNFSKCPNIHFSIFDLLILVAWLWLIIKNSYNNNSKILPRNRPVHWLYLYHQINQARAPSAVLTVSGTAYNHIGKLYSPKKEGTSSMPFLKNPQHQNMPWHCVELLAQVKPVPINTSAVKQCRCSGASDGIHALDHFSLLLQL